jgi:hypothetical protein
LHGHFRENRLRTAKMGAGLSEKVGKAGDPRALADDVEEITVFAGCTVLLMLNST